MSNQNRTGKNIGLIALGCGLGCTLPFLLPFVLLIFSIPFLLSNVEAPVNIYTITEAQQDYFSKNNRFASDISELKLDIESETENYSYGIKIIEPKQSVKITAKPKKSDLLSYTGAVFTVKNQGQSKLSILSEICVSEEASLTPPEMPKLVGNKIQCHEGSTPISDFNDETITEDLEGTQL